MHVSVKTVETYRAHIKQKLHLTTAPELMRVAIEWLHATEVVKGARPRWQMRAGHTCRVQDFPALTAGPPQRLPQERFHVGHVQPDRGFLQKIQRGLQGAPLPQLGVFGVAHAARQLGDELHALRLAAAQRRTRLTQPQVTQTCLRQSSWRGRAIFDTGAKNSAACSMVNWSTCPMFLSL